jgi:hypothetical protein
MALHGRALIDLFGAASMITGMSRHDVPIGGSRSQCRSRSVIAGRRRLRFPELDDVAVRLAAPATHAATI